MILRQINQMMHVDHPTISSFTKFFMSTDFFVYISRAKIMSEEVKHLTSLQSIPNFNEIEHNTQKQRKGKQVKQLDSDKNLDFKSFSSLMLKDNFEQVHKFGTQMNLPDNGPSFIVSSLNLASKITELNTRQHNKFLQTHLYGISQLKKALPKTLFRALTEHKQTLSTKQIANVAKEVLFALQFIHSKDVVHLNLNPSCILIPRANPEDFFNGVPVEEEAVERGDEGDEGEKVNVFLFNFCQASQFTKKIKFNEPEEPHQQSVKFSEICFMAPERISGNIKVDNIEVCKRADIWSIGILIYLMFSGKLPFSGETGL